MSEDTYLKDNIKKCVDYVMSKNDDDKRRIITGMFQYNDYLINEQLLVKALNDKEKQEWFNNDMFDTYKLEIERLHNIIKEVREYITSYESIETIQQFDHNKNNKDLDYSTIDEMTRRYMMVHDKILKILDKEVISNE